MENARNDSILALFVVRISLITSNMTDNRKISKLELDFLKNLPPYVTKKDKNAYKALKNTLMDSIEGVFDDLGINIQKKTRDALEHMCFRSMEQGFVHTSPKYLNAEYGVGKSTVYTNLGHLLDAGILCKKNFTSKNHNGLGAAIYFFTSHPYFDYIKDHINLNWKADENANEKAEKAENLCVASDSSDSNPSTISLPSLDLNDIKDIDLHTNVESSSSTNKIIKYVPKAINELYAGIFDFRLRVIWQKITQAWKTIKQSALIRDDLITVGANICKRIYQIWKERMRDNQEMTIDEMAAFAYKSARETFYNTLAAMHMQDYDIEENTLMGEAVRSIPTYEKICKQVYPDYSYEAVKKHVSSCLEWGYRMLSNNSIKRIIENYDRYTTISKHSRMTVYAYG